MDFIYTTDLDLQVTGDKYDFGGTGETELINALFTDERVNGKRGYWFDITQSKLWVKIEQSRYRDIDINEIEEYATRVANKIEELGIYEKVYISVKKLDGFAEMEVKCKNDNRIVFNRKYKV